MKKEISILLVIIGAFALIQSLNFVNIPQSRGRALLVQTHDDTYFQNISASGDWVLLDFWAPWCGPCRKLKPSIAELAEENQERLNVLSINKDEAPGLVNQFRIDGIPALVLMYKGREVDRRLGYMPKSELKNWVGAEIGKNGDAAP